MLDLVLDIFEAKNHISLKICCFSSECSNNRDLKKEGMIKHEKKRWTSDKHFIKLTLSCFATTVHFILQQFSKSILIICSLKALCTTKHISVLNPFLQEMHRNIFSHFHYRITINRLQPPPAVGTINILLPNPWPFLIFFILKFKRQITIKNMRATLLPNPHAVSKSSHKRMMTRNMFPA